MKSKFFVLSAALALLASLAVAQSLPNESAQLLKKLEAFEKEQYAEITEKRTQVIRILEGQLRSQLAKSPEAIAIQTAIDSIQNQEGHQPFELGANSATGQNSTQIRGAGNRQVFELLLERISVVCRNNRQAEQAQAESLIEISLDGAEIYSNKRVGAHILKINQSGLVSKEHFPNIFDSDRAVADVREKIIASLRQPTEETVTILAVAEACAAVTKGDTEGVVQIIGGRTKKISFRQPYICIGYSGLRRGGAIEVFGEVVGEPARREAQ